MICGSARLVPQSKFSSNGVAVTNFCLGSLHEDTCKGVHSLLPDLGHLLVMTDLVTTLLRITPEV